MAEIILDKIQIKRGLKANLPILDEGEPAYCTDTREYFIGTSGGNVLINGGGGTVPSNVILFEEWVGGETVTIDTGTTVPDNTPPNNVTSVSASNVSQTSMTIGWGAVSDAVSYEVWRNGALLTTVSTTNYNATGLTANTSYSWVIKAKDASGNTASGSTPLVQSTLAEDVTPPNDTTAPVLTITPAQTFTDPLTVNMSTDDSEATIYYTLDDTDPITSGTKLIYSAPLTLTETDTVKAYAKDTAGNDSAVQTITYTKEVANPSFSGYVNDASLIVYNEYPENNTIISDNTDSWLTGASNFTISMTVRSQLDTGDLPLLQQYGTTAVGSKFRLARSFEGRFKFYFYGINSVSSNQVNVTTYTEINSDITNYYHVTAVRSGSELAIYLNGVFAHKITTLNSDTHINTSTQPMKIGLVSKDVQAKNVVCYNRALTTTEITQNYNALK